MGKLKDNEKALREELGPALPAIQRYKIGYHSDEWGVRSLSPVGIYDDAGPWVRYEDHIAALTTGQVTVAQQPEGGVVAYLDVGAGGYLDLGSELSEDALQQLPKGRHALVIAGTYGIDGYTAASTPQSAPAGVLEDAARWHWMAEYIIGTRTDLDDELIACPTVDELRKLVDADLAARAQQKAGE